jgi:hypothetical protein
VRNRGKVVDVWSAAQQRATVELQFADDGETDATEQDIWRHLRSEATSRRLRRV